MEGKNSKADVYTYDSFSAEWGPGPAVKKAFEADCNCELKFVALEEIPPQY